MANENTPWTLVLSSQKNTVVELTQNLAFHCSQHFSQVESLTLIIEVTYQ